MRPELENQLYENYPTLYPPDGPVRSMTGGIAVGDGWFNLIDSLSNYICFYVESRKMNPIIAAQVKTKFGGLRFYLTEGTTEGLQGAISFAESMSYYICELCAKPAYVNEERPTTASLCMDCKEDRGLL